MHSFYYSFHIHNAGLLENRWISINLKVISHFLKNTFCYFNNIAMQLATIFLFISQFIVKLNNFNFKLI